MRALFRNTFVPSTSWFCLLLDFYPVRPSSWHLYVTKKSGHDFLILSLLSALVLFGIRLSLSHKLSYNERKQVHLRGRHLRVTSIPQSAKPSHSHLLSSVMRAPLNFSWRACHLPEDSCESSAFGWEGGMREEMGMGRMRRFDLQTAWVGMGKVCWEGEVSSV